MMNFFGCGHFNLHDLIGLVSANDRTQLFHVVVIRMEFGSLAREMFVARQSNQGYKGTEWNSRLSVQACMTGRWVDACNSG